MLRVFRKERFNVGFGWKIRLTYATSTRKIPAADVATIVPEFNQSNRSPWSMAP